MNSNTTMRHKISTLVLALAFAIITIIILPSVANAEVGDFVNPNDEIKEEADNGMFQVETGDLNGYDRISKWLLARESYIFVQDIEEDDDKNVTDYNIYFNAPSLQRAIRNMFQTINSGGFQAGMVPTSDSVEQDESKWTTAAAKYGWTLPGDMYVGEMPALSLDLTSVAAGMANPVNATKIVLTGLGNKFLSAVNSIWNFFTGSDNEAGEVSFSMSWTPGNNDVKNMTYNTMDYFDYAVASDDDLEEWLATNWDKLRNHKDLFKDVAVGETGENLLEDNVIDDTVKGEKRGENLLNAIINKCGSNYKDALTSIIGIAQEELKIERPVTKITRTMPYDYDDLSESSKEYVGVSDPRVEMFGDNDSAVLNIDETSKASIFSHIGGLITMIVFFFAWLANLLNSFCSMDFLNTVGLDLNLFWGGTLGQFLFNCLCVAVTVTLIIGMVNVVRGKKSTAEIFGRTVLGVFMIVITSCLIVYPDTTYNTIKDVFNKVTNLGTIVLESNTTFDELTSSNATTSDKSELRYWMLGYDTWALYHTNHTSSDTEANTYDPSSGLNEYTDYTNTATLNDGKSMNLWPVILIEELNNKNYNASLRVIDHYMAPKVVKTGYPSFTVEQNDYYNGYVQSDLPVANIIYALLALALTFLKFLCFIEFIIDVMLLFMKLLLSSVSSSGAKSSFASVFKAIGWDLVRIIAFDLFTTLAMYMTYISSGTYSIIVAFLMLAMFAGFIKYIIVHIDSPLSPALFRTMHSAYDRAGKVIFSGSHKYKKSLSMLSSNPVERSSNSPSKYNVEGRNMHEDFKQRAQDYRHVDSLLENNTKNVDTSLLGKAKDRFANNMPEVNEDGKINHSKDQHKL